MDVDSSGKDDYISQTSRGADTYNQSAPQKSKLARNRSPGSEHSPSPPRSHARDKRQRRSSQSRSVSPHSRSVSRSRSLSRSLSHSRSVSRSRTASYSRSPSRSPSPVHHPRGGRRTRSRSSRSRSRGSRSRSRSSRRERPAARGMGLKDPRDKSTRQRWTNQVLQIGEVMKEAVFHFCDTCDRPIFTYGRLIPCKHVFCLNCADDKDKCPRCEDRVQRTERAEFRTVFMCYHGGPLHSNLGCRRTYLSQRDLEAHMNHRHKTRQTGVGGNTATGGGAVGPACGPPQVTTVTTSTAVPFTSTGMAPPPPQPYATMFSRPPPGPYPHPVGPSQPPPPIRMPPRGPPFMSQPPPPGGPWQRPPYRG